VQAQIHEIRPFDLRSASRDEYACLNTFKNISRAEILPEDPPHPLSEDIDSWQSLPAVMKETAWAAWDESRERIVALGQAQIYDTGDNEHMLEFEIQVLPEFRRHGLGRRLLALAVERAHFHHRRLMIAEASGRVPAGGEFLSRIGARAGLEAHQNQLRIADLDRGLVHSWMDQAADLAVDYRIDPWDGPSPDGSLQALADLMQVVGNDEPRDTLDVEDTRFTPELVRQFEGHQLSGGNRRWVLCLADARVGSLVGLTEVFWSPNRPAILLQGFTGVMPDHRSKGLGRWLKAAMLEKILREHPEVEVIRAGNANSNAPMLKINRALGFKPFISWTVWQVETETVEKYLAARP
jgi:mycothiol synthase